MFDFSNIKHTNSASKICLLYTSGDTLCWAKPSAILSTKIYLKNFVVKRILFSARVLRFPLLLKFPLGIPNEDEGCRQRY